jgi:hypothetical protein
MRRFVHLLLLLSIFCAPLAAQTDDQLLDTLQHTAFNFFWQEANATSGLIKDRSNANGGGTAQCSIASLGFGLTAVCIGVDHGWVSRAAAADRVHAALKTLWTKPQGIGTSGYSGYKGFYFHFLDMASGLRTWSSELSSIDSGLLFSGVIYSREYFDGTDSVEVEIRALADSIYRRADWQWFRNYNAGLLMGWMPETQFAGYSQWTGYCEAMIMYILGYGSPTHPITDKYGWQEWTGGYLWQTQYSQTYVVFPPLFGHQYSHCWIDFRGIQDSWIHAKGIDYFENSRRATLAQRAYCAANPGGKTGYSDSLWGITASDDPNGYSARGAPPPQDDNGTLVPTAGISSIPFAPEVVMPLIRNLWNSYRPQLWARYGFRDAFNPGSNWWGSDVIGIDQGPIIIMIENYRTGSVWSKFMQNADIQRGLQRIGFTPVVGVNQWPVTAPDIFELRQNFPNPFNPVTTISYAVPRAAHVTLNVYNLMGEEICKLVDESKSAGTYSVQFNGGNLPAGIYFYTISAGRQTETKKLVLLR